MPPNQGIIAEAPGGISAGNKNFLEEKTMKNTVKILSLVMALVLSLCVFTGCSNNAVQGDGESEEVEVEKLVFGTNAEFPPFEYVAVDGIIDGKYDGIDMAIADQIAKDCGKQATIENIEFDSLIIALQNGQIDAAIAGMTITDERKESVDFSVPYYTATQVMIVREDSDIKAAADMEGKVIAVVQGYTAETSVQKLGFSYETFKKGTECILELVNGKCDVVVIDSATASKYVADNEGLVIVEDDLFEKEEYGIAVKKGNTELLNQINASVNKMLEDGTISALSVQYQEAQADEDAAAEADAAEVAEEAPAEEAAELPEEEKAED